MERIQGRLFFKNTSPETVPHCLIAFSHELIKGLTHRQVKILYLITSQKPIHCKLTSYFAVGLSSLSEGQTAGPNQRQMLVRTGSSAS